MSEWAHVWIEQLIVSRIHTNAVMLLLHTLPENHLSSKPNWVFTVGKNSLDMGNLLLCATCEGQAPDKVYGHSLNLSSPFTLIFLLHPSVLFCLPLWFLPLLPCIPSLIFPACSFAYSLAGEEKQTIVLCSIECQMLIDWRAKSWRQVRRQMYKALEMGVKPGANR